MVRKLNNMENEIKHGITWSIARNTEKREK
jgi:hypothetical protein